MRYLVTLTRTETYQVDADDADLARDIAIDAWFLEGAQPQVVSVDEDPNLETQPAPKPKAA